MDFKKISPEQLEVGMKITVQHPILYGWCSYTSLTRYDRRVKAFVSIRNGMWELEKISPTKFIGTLEEMEETERLVKALLSRYK